MNVINLFISEILKWFPLLTLVRNLCSVFMLKLIENALKKDVGLIRLKSKLLSKLLPQPNGE